MLTAVAPPPPPSVMITELDHTESGLLLVGYQVVGPGREHGRTARIGTTARKICVVIQSLCTDDSQTLLPAIDS